MKQGHPPNTMLPLAENPRRCERLWRRRPRHHCPLKRTVSSERERWHTRLASRLVTHVWPQLPKRRGCCCPPLDNLSVMALLDAVKRGVERSTAQRPHPPASNAGQDHSPPATNLHKHDSCSGARDLQLLDVWLGSRMNPGSETRPASAMNSGDL